MLPYQVIDPKKGKKKDNLEYLYIYIEDDFAYERQKKKKGEDEPERGSIVIDIL